MIFNNDPLPQFPGEGVARDEPLRSSEYASWWLRVGGSIIDGLLVIAVAYVVASVVGLHPFAIHYVGHGATRRGQLRHFVAFVLMENAFSFVYATWLLSSKRCATLGMRAARIRLEALDGKKAALGRVAGRMAIVIAASVLALIAPIVGLASLLDFLWPLWDPKRQTLHDKLVGTVVRKGIAT